MPFTISIRTTLPGINRSLGLVSLKSTSKLAVPYYFKFNGTTDMPAEVGTLICKVRLNDFDQDVALKDLKVLLTGSIGRSF